jgi:hypothetical protein
MLLLRYRSWYGHESNCGKFPYLLIDVASPNTPVSIDVASPYVPDDDDNRVEGLNRGAGGIGLNSPLASAGAAVIEFR